MNRIDSYLSPKCEVRESRIGEFGVFAKERLVAQELVAVFGGKIYSRQEIEDLALVYPRFATHPVSVHPQFSLGPADPNAACDDTERFNHSCDPNIGIQGQIVLLARRDIAADEELCFDYDTTEIAPPPKFHFPCRCGAKRCRGIVDGSQWCDPEFQRQNQGWLSWGVLEHIRRSGC